MIFWEQSDGSVIDKYGNTLSMEERLAIIDVYENLPVSHKMDDIIHAVKNHSITIIQWETGSGKTTQVPKNIFRQLWKQVVVTQPRVISALSNAQRVSLELLADTGNVRFSVWEDVWYRTGQWVSSKFTSPLSFHTDWLELMRQWVQGIIPEVLVIDEVHNFSIATELLMMLAKYRKDVKIVIMSATLEPSIFQNYFASVSKDIPCIQVPWRTFDVKKYFNDGENPVEEIATYYEKGKNILYFVPGKREIAEEIAKIRKRIPWVDIHPLHSELPKEEQTQLLQKTTEAPRIIVTTNIAEESITIPYIDVVVDSGTHKMSSFTSLGIEQLRLEDTSQANALQRAGRAWRTKEGIYVRENFTPFDELDKYPVPPIQRQMLDRYILVLLSQWTDLKTLYRESKIHKKKLFVHDIDEKLLSLSYERLSGIWAIDGKWEITEIGRALLTFPLDVYQSRILYEGIRRKCSEDMLYAAAILERRWFLWKDTTWKKILERRKVEGKNESDLFSYIELYKLLTATKLIPARLKLFEGLVDSEELFNFHKKNTQDLMFFEMVDVECLWIKVKRLREVYNLVEELKHRFQSLWLDLTHEGTMHDKKVCLLAGQIHNIFEVGKGKVLKNIEHKKWAMEFVPGDISFTHERLLPWHLCAGLPFIIWWEAGKEDLNLVTFLTLVDKSDIDECRSSLGEAVHFDFTSRDEMRWNIGDSELAFTKSIERFQEGKYVSTMDSQNYLFDSVLVDFLLTRNLPIKKWLSARDETFIFTFRQLLIRHLKSIESDIKYRLEWGLQTVQKSFWNDTFVLDSFLKSKDPFIRKFLSGKSLLPQEVLSAAPKKERFIVPKIAPYVESGRVFNTEEEGFKHLLSFKLSKIEELVKENSFIGDIKKIVIDRLIENLVATSPEFNNIASLYHTIDRALPHLTEEYIKTLLSDMNKAKRKRKTLEKLMHEKAKLLSFIQFLHPEEGEERKEVKMGIEEMAKFIQKVLNNSLKGKTPTKWQKASVVEFLAWSEVQHRRRKKAKEAIEHIYFWAFKEELRKINEKIWAVQRTVNFEHIPYAGDIRKNVETLAQDLLVDEYFRYVFNGKIFSITHDIILDIISKRRWVEAIITQMLEKISLTKLSPKNEKTAILMEKVNDYLETVGTYKLYKSVSLPEAEKMIDIDALKQENQKVTSLLEELQSLSQQIKQMKKEVLHSS